MNGLLLVALTGISLLYLHLSPCEAIPFQNAYGPYVQREYYQRRPAEGRQVAHYLPSNPENAYMLGRMKKEVDFDLPGEDTVQFDEAIDISE